MINTLTIGCNYEFSDDGELWDEGFLMSISHRVPLTYQSLDGDKKEWYSHIRPVNKKPVFTQAMADAGYMIEAGMLFETTAGQYTAEYTNKKSVCFTDENGFLVTVTRGNAKPIDTRTDKEKAIDDLLDKSVIFCNKDTMRTCFKIAYDEWAAKSDD